jgi:hypothetical protein
MNRLTCTGLLLLAALGAACGTVAAPVTVAHPLGSRQCEGPGPAPQSLAQRLIDAGVAVAAVGCGHDGRMRPAVCGAPDGALAVMDIDAAQLPRARELGFQPLADWPDARRVPCRLTGS